MTTNDGSKGTGVRAVTFDLDGTLFDHPRASRHALARLCEERGVDAADFVPRFERLNEALWKAYGEGRIAAGDIRSRRFEQTFAEMGRDPREGAEWAEPYLAAYARTGYLLDGAAEVLERIAGRVPTAIVTNGYRDVQSIKLRTTGLARWVHTVVTSEEIGRAKPAPDVFLAAADRLGVDPGEIVHVGDSLASDVAGALGAGFGAIWYRDAQGAADGSAGGVPPGVPVVSSLRDLPATLELAARGEAGHDRVAEDSGRRTGNRSKTP